MSAKLVQEREEKRYLIRSRLKGWWRPNSQGYTDDLSFAGVYGEKQASEIIERTNLPTEMVPIGELAESIRGDINEERVRSQLRIDRLNRLLSLI